MAVFLLEVGGVYLGVGTVYVVVDEEGEYVAISSVLLESGDVDAVTDGVGIAVDAE